MCENMCVCVLEVPMCVNICVFVYLYGDDDEIDDLSSLWLLREIRVCV